MLFGSGGNGCCTASVAEYAKHDRAEFVRVVQEAQSSQQTAEVRKQRTRLATAKQRVSELEVLLCKIYEDNILGKLSDSRYATLDAQYAKEQAELTAEISALEKAIKSYETHICRGIWRFSLIFRFLDTIPPTPERQRVGVAPEKAIFRGRACESGRSYSERLGQRRASGGTWCS